VHASDCEDVAVLNQLDGFNLQARISVPFAGDIDPTSISSKTVFLVRLRDARTGREHGGEVVGINYIVWDPTTRELSFRPDTSLDQHTTYALVVSTACAMEGVTPLALPRASSAIAMTSREMLIRTIAARW
jgi:hypothetical protein